MPITLPVFQIDGRDCTERRRDIAHLLFQPGGVFLLDSAELSADAIMCPITQVCARFLAGLFRSRSQSLNGPDAFPVSGYAPIQVEGSAVGERWGCC